jgi:hypothetical protein
MSTPTTYRRKGQPTIYDEATVLATLYSHTGAATARELSVELGISTGTFAQWQRQYPAFKAAVAEVRSYVDDAVESALAKRARGFDYLEISTSTGPKGTTVTEKEVFVPPDVGAAKFWLTNRRREAWTERKTVEIEGGLKAALDRVAEVLDLDLSDWEDVTDAETR